LFRDLANGLPLRNVKQAEVSFNCTMAIVLAFTGAEHLGDERPDALQKLFEGLQPMKGADIGLVTLWLNDELETPDVDPPAEFPFPTSGSRCLGVIEGDTHGVALRRFRRLCAVLRGTMPLLVIALALAERFDDKEEADHSELTACRLPTSVSEVVFERKKWQRLRTFFDAMREAIEVVDGRWREVLQGLTRNDQLRRTRQEARIRRQVAGSLRTALSDARERHIA